MNDSVILTTARLRLRAVTLDDAEALFEAFGDVDLMQYWSSAAHADAEQTRTHLETRMTDSPENMTLAVTWAGDDRALGTVSIMPRKPGVFEIGYIFARAAWGQGVAREAVACVIDHIFASMRARRIYADTDPDNSGSIALLERLGFVREGYLREEWETHIGVRDTALYGLLKREWNTAERLPHQPVAPAKAGAAGK